MCSSDLNLIPFVMALFHFRSHSGSKKLFLEIRNKFWWNRMQDDILDFVRGCVLCNVLKVSNLGKGEIGVPRVVPSPRHTWQIDICQGFPSVNGATSFLNCVDLYSGYCLPIPLRSENSETIATLIENYLIKP